MDTLTHAISGMLVARASHREQDTISLTLRSWVGFLVGAFPDIDFMAGYFGISAFLEYHRGITHSVLMMPIWALVLAWVMSQLTRLTTKQDHHWKNFYVLCLLALGIHIFGDVITAYGTEVFSPISNYRLSFPSTFIIDLYFSGIILVAILLSVFIKRHAKNISLAGLGVLLGYILLQNYWMHQALEDTYAHVPVKHLKVKKINAIPQPLSPFNWKIIVETEDKYYLRYVNIHRDKVKQAEKQDGMLKRVDALYTQKNFYNWTVVNKFGVGPIQELAKEIWQHDRMNTVRRFMEYPAVQRLEQWEEATCVFFSDQRFVLGDIRAPFIFGACQHNETKEMKFLRWKDGGPAKFD